MKKLKLILGRSWLGISSIIINGTLDQLVRKKKDCPGFLRLGVYISYDLKVLVRGEA